jgi:hypothetical protein
MPVLNMRKFRTLGVNDVPQNILFYKYQSRIGGIPAVRSPSTPHPLLVLYVVSDIFVLFNGLADYKATLPKMLGNVYGNF